MTTVAFTLLRQFYLVNTRDRCTYGKQIRKINTMSLRKSVLKNVLKDPRHEELSEEFNNFVKRVGEVGNIVKGMTSRDKAKAAAATKLADQYLAGKVIVDENVKLTVKSDRTVINEKAFKNMGNENAGEMDKDAWMAEVSKDANKRAMDRKVRQERADTFKTQAVKAFRREEYEKALSCYNKAIEQIKDNAMLYCDRALTNIKLGKFDKVLEDCDWALRINESSFKARLYRAKAYKEMEELDKLAESKRELDEMFPQHDELITYFLEKQQTVVQEEVEVEEDEEVCTIEV